MSDRTRNIVGFVAAGLVAALMLVSVATKLYLADANAEIHAMFVRGGIYPLRYSLAVADVLIPLVFLWRRTSTLGLLLMVGYWGGATATVLTHGDYQELPAHLSALALLAVASWFRHPEVWARALATSPAPSARGGVAG